VGSLIAIEMAHHYLGHYRKYQGQLLDANNNAISINQFLTADEWHKAVLKGGRNAMDCGLAPDGIKLLLVTLGSMKTRPPWTIYFLPPNAKVKKAIRDLSRMEEHFFGGFK
jgi:hypothetical protein